tara:strand:+ start:204 stop:818 length:615 start_codon:yes stop_codon:yes gene_type:complete
MVILGSNCASIPESSISQSESQALNLYLASISERYSSYKKGRIYFSPKIEGASFVEFTVVFENNTNSPVAVFLPALTVSPQMEGNSDTGVKSIDTRPAFYEPCCGWEGFKKTTSLWWNEGRGNINSHLLEIPPQEKRAATLLYVIRDDQKYTGLSYIFDESAKALAEDWAKRPGPGNNPLYASPQNDYAPANLSLKIPAAAYPE